MTKKKFNIVVRALKRLNLDESDKADLFFDSRIKGYEKQIKLRKRKLIQIKEIFEEKLEELNEQLTELKDERIAAFETIEPDRINSVADRKSYLETYDDNCSYAMNKVKYKEDEIELETSRYTKEKEGIEKEIKIFEKKLSFIIE